MPCKFWYVDLWKGKAHNQGLQPTHYGEIVQTGYNAGPRHARIFGYAKSFTASKLSNAAREEQDSQIVGAASLTWQFSRVSLPTEIMDEIDSTLAKHNMPRIATEHVSPSGMCLL